MDSSLARAAAADTAKAAEREAGLFVVIDAAVAVTVDAAGAGEVAGTDGAADAICVEAGAEEESGRGAKNVGAAASELETVEIAE